MKSKLIIFSTLFSLLLLFSSCEKQDAIPDYKVRLSVQANNVQSCIIKYKDAEGNFHTQTLAQKEWQVEFDASPGWTMYLNVTGQQGGTSGVFLQAYASQSSNEINSSHSIYEGDHLSTPINSETSFDFTIEKYLP